MRLKLPHFALLALLLAVCGCDDDTGTMGWGLLPKSDAIATYTKIINLRSESVRADSVYARTEVGYLGRFSDPEFGYYEASFLSEFNTVESYKLPDAYKYDEATKKASGMMAGDTCVDIQLSIIYDEWFGDSATACRVTAYELNDLWKKERRGNGLFYRYTNIDVSRYYDSNQMLGSTAYTAYDYTVTDEERNATDGEYLFYTPHIDIKLDRSIGQRILDMNRTHPEYFASNEAFQQNVMPGVYLKTNFGDGTIIYVKRIDLQLKFRFHYLDDNGIALKKQVSDSEGEAGSDSLYYKRQTVFSTTPEIIQATRFENSDKLDEKVEETGHTYLKSPAGIFTAVDIPYDEIYKTLGNDSLNAAKLSFTSYAQESAYESSMKTPSTILLIRKKDMKPFFEGNKTPDNATTYLSTLSEQERNKYVFSNIARLISVTHREKQAAKKAAGSMWDAAMEAQWEEENKVLVMPVVIEKSQQSQSSGESAVISTLHDLEPKYVKLVGGSAKSNGELNSPIKLEIIYTEFQ